jgi:flagellar biosynthesis/type III secretory pathway chaperone
MINQEERKISFEQCCLKLVVLLDEEYQLAKSNNYKALAEINEKKSPIQTEFQDFLFQFSLTPRGIPDDIVEFITQVHKLSQRNAAFLAGAIEGTSTILRELRKAAEIKTFTGLYNSDGSFKSSNLNSTEIGKA